MPTKTPEVFALDLRPLGQRIKRVIVEFLPPGAKGGDKIAVIPVRKEDERYLRLKTAMTSVTAMAARTNFDPGLGAEDTHYEHALSAFGAAVKGAAQGRGKRGEGEDTAMFDTALSDLQRELPFLEHLQPDHPTLGAWQTLMHTHFENALTQIQNPPALKTK